MFEDLRKAFDETLQEYKFWRNEVLRRQHLHSEDDRIILAEYYGQLCGLAKSALIVYGVESLMDIVETLKPLPFDEGDDDENED